MSMTVEDYAYDQYMYELYEEHSKEAIEEFTEERLTSYYTQNQFLAKPAYDFLVEAIKQNKLNPTVGLLLSVISIEVGLRETLLKPIVFELVHDKSAASLITELTISHTGMDRYRGLLMHILQEHGGVDLDKYKRDLSQKPLWEELKEVQKIRNLVLHRAENVLQESADLAVDVATEIVKNIFPQVVSQIGLHLHNGYQICSNRNCKIKDSLN